jgi:hypothetical protein
MAKMNDPPVTDSNRVNEGKKKQQEKLAQAQGLDEASLKDRELREDGSPDPDGVPPKRREELKGTKHPDQYRTVMPNEKTRPGGAMPSSNS